MILLSRAVSAVCAVLLASCASYDGSSLRQGATADEVRAAMGKPTATWRDGASEVLEYARGPEGLHTYLVYLDATGRLGEIRQVLDEKNFARIEIGKSTKEEVRRVIGGPGQTFVAARSGIEWWDYRYLDRSRKMRLEVGFDGAGVVRQLERLVDPSEVSYDGPATM